MDYIKNLQENIKEIKKEIKEGKTYLKPYLEHFNKLLKEERKNKVYKAD